MQAKCKIFLLQNGFDVPNGEVEVKDEPENEPTESESSTNKNQVHPSIEQLYTKYPKLKLPKSLVHQNMAPNVSLAANEVEKYFKVRDLNMNSFIYKPVEKTGSDVAKEGTEVRKTVSPLKIIRKEKEKYTCTPMLKRKLSMSGSDSGPAKVTKEVAREQENNNSSNSSGSNDLKQISKLTTVKSKTLLECHVCRSFHSTSISLKMHLSKHRVCQFCKKTFKSLAAKDEHLKDSCEVKRILTSQPFVSLEPVHLNPSIRSKHSQSFEGFPALPSEDTSTDVVNVRVDLLGGTSDSGEQRNSAVPISPCSVSIVKPDFVIKNGTLPCNMTLNDKQFFKEVLRWSKEKVKASRTFTENMIQTNLPSNLNIKTDSTLGACEFKGLKDQLLVFTVPINITKGPFKVQYKHRKPNKNKETISDIEILPVAFTRKNRGAMGHENNMVKVSAPAKTITTTQPPTILNSQISKPIQSKGTLPKPTPPANSTSATPLLQSYVSSISQAPPLLGFQDFQQKFLNTALQNRNGKQVVTAVSKVPPGFILSKPSNIFNNSNIRLVNRNSHIRMPTPPQNRTFPAPNSVITPIRVPASSSSNTTNSGMQMVRSIVPYRMTFNRLVPVIYNTGRDQVKSPHQSVHLNNQPLSQNASSSITREASKPSQYPVAKKKILNVVEKKTINEVERSVENKSVQQTVVPSVAPTEDSQVKEKDVATVVSSHQPTSGVSIQSNPVFRVKNIRELQ